MRFSAATLTRAATVVAAVGLSASLSGCGNSEVCVIACAPGERFSSETGLEATVTLTKSGGVAGINETVEVEPDGSWTHVASHGEQPSEPEQLAEEDMEQLWLLLGEPALYGPGDADSGDQCNDYFIYSLTIAPTDDTADTDLSSGECGEHPNETFTEIVDFLYEHTSMGDS